MSDLSWRHTWPELGPDFVLQRARDGEPEIIGRVMIGRRSSHPDVTDGWSWSLTSTVRPVGIAHPGYLTGGFEATQRGARDALVAAWRAEEAFRAEVRASDAFAGLAPSMRSFLIHGQPVPAVRQPVNDDEPEDSAAEARWMDEAVALIRSKHEIEWDAALERYTLDGLPITDGQVVKMAVSMGKATLSG